MDFELRESDVLVRALAHNFADEVLKPRVRASDEQGVFDRDAVRRLGEAGFLGGPLPREYGGSGFTHLQSALVYEEIGRVDSSVRGFMAVQIGLVALGILDYGDETQKRTWLPRLASGDAMGCYALTEENAGSDVASMETTAEEDGDGFRLNGRKIWITNGNVADVAVVFATVDRGKRHRGITAFLVPADTEGLQRSAMPGRELGHRASDHAILEFRDCRVPRSAVLGDVGSGFAVAMGALDHGRLGVAAGAVGILQGCLDACLDFVGKRRQFGRRLGDFEMVQAEIAEMHADLWAARFLTYWAAAIQDRGGKATLATSTAKLFAVNAAVKAANQAVLLHGGRGYSSEYPVERFLRDAKGLEIYEGTAHIQRIIIARELIGRDKE